MTTYQGHDVLDQVAHDRVGALEDTFRRGAEVLDGQTGARDAFVRTAAPAPARSFVWTCLTRAEAAVLRAFITARRGRALPFWVPTYQQDLRLTADAAAGATALTVRWIGYARHLFAGGGWRRHLALYDPARQLAYARVTSATDPGNLVTESLGLAAPLARDFPADGTVVSFLRLCRLDDDAVRIEWRGHTARAQLALREIPLEAPQ